MEKQNFRAVNAAGFMVDLIRPMPKPPWKKQPDMVGNEEQRIFNTWTGISPHLSSARS
jgi:hypothetical protein